MMGDLALLEVYGGGELHVTPSGRRWRMHPLNEVVRHVIDVLDGVDVLPECTLRLSIGEGVVWVWTVPQGQLDQRSRLSLVKVYGPDGRIRCATTYVVVRRRYDLWDLDREERAPSRN